MAKNRERTPEEQRRIDERIAFVQANPQLTKQEARTRFYVQTRAAELEAQGKTVDRAALRRKFEMGEVTREGFYTPSDVQAAQRRRAALASTRTTDTGGFGQTGQTGVTNQQMGGTSTSPETSTKPTRSVRKGPETTSWIQPTAGSTASPKPAKPVTSWQDEFAPRMIQAGINRIEGAVTRTARGVGGVIQQTGDDINTTFVNPAINVVGRMFGQNPNLRTADPLTATTVTAGTLLDIGTAGASRAASTGIRAATPGVTRMLTGLIGEAGATAAGYGARNISGRAIGGQITAGAGQAIKGVGQRVVDRLPGGQRIKNVGSKIDEMMTPFQYRQLREGVAKIKPAKPVAEGAAGATGRTGGNLTGQLRAGRQAEGAATRAAMPTDEDLFYAQGYDIDDIVDEPLPSQMISPEDFRELDEVENWQQAVSTPKPPTQDVVPPAQTTKPPTTTTQTGRGTDRPTLPLGPNRPEPTTEAGKSLKALFGDITEGIQETTARIPTPTPRPPAAAASAAPTPTPPSAPASTGGQTLDDLLGPEFQARREAADAARARSEAGRTARRRADLTPEEIEARKVEERARDAERKRASRAKAAEARRAAKEAEAQKAAEVQATPAPSAPSEPLSATEQAREAAGETPQNWFVTRRQQQEAFQAQQGTAGPVPQTQQPVTSAQEAVVEAREAVTRAVDVPSPAPQAPTPAVAPEAPSAPVRPAPVQPTRASDTGTRGTGRQKPPAQTPTPSRPVQTPAAQTPTPTAPAPTPAGTGMDLSGLTTQELFNDWMRSGGREVMRGMDPLELVSTIKQNPSLAGFLEKNPINPPSTPGGKVPGQMKAVSNEGTQTRFNRGGVQIPEELTRTINFTEPVAKPTSLKESQELGKVISDLEGKLKTLTDLTELRGGARTATETTNIEVLKFRIEEVRRTMQQFNEEYIAGVSQKARPMSASEEARLKRMEKSKRAGGTPKETPIDTPTEETPMGDVRQIEPRGTQRRTSDPDWEREVNPDDIDLFDDPSY